jgi:hypothetical protein
MKRLFVWLFFCPIVGYAQTLMNVNEDAFKMYRFDQLNDTSSTSLFYGNRWVEGASVASKKINNFYIHPVTLRSTFSSIYPKDFDNGPVWTGKGLSGMVSGGVSYKTKNLEITFSPIVWYAQNQEYNLEPQTYTSPNGFRYPFDRRIDWPQRLGEESITAFNLGQSRIKYSWKGKLYAKLSNENMWWGPSHINSITMTNTASGFPHFSLGIDDLISTGIGHFGANLFWGRLNESDYFNDDNVDGKLFSALTFEYHPSFIDGFEAGIARLVYKSWLDLKPADFFKVLSGFGNNPDSTQIGENDEFDQLASFFLRWRFPEIGFEAFYEYSRNDFGGDIQNLIIGFPDHSRFYSFGFSKMIDTGFGDLRLQTEFNNLSRSDTRLLGPSPILYTHPIAQGGYTHNGQLVGASVGPGSNSQYISLTLKRDKVVYEANTQRTSWNDDFFYQFANTRDLNRDVEMAYGINALVYFDNSSLKADLRVSDRGNWLYSREVGNVFFQLSYTKGF